MTCSTCKHWTRKTDKFGDCHCREMQFDAKSILAQPGLWPAPQTYWDYTCVSYTPSTGA